jgi:plasmid stability protein
MDTTIRNLDEAAYRALKARAALRGTTIGELVNEAIRLYLASTEAFPKTRSILDKIPVEFPEGDENLSEDIDLIVYGVRLREPEQ